jgi:hypothetical protein
LTCFILVGTFRADRACSCAFGVGIQANGTRGAFGQRNIVGGPVVGGPDGALLARGLTRFILVGTFRADRACSCAYLSKKTDFTRNAFGQRNIVGGPVVGGPGGALLAGTLTFLILVGAFSTDSAFGQRDIVGGPVVVGPDRALLARGLTCFILVGAFRADRALGISFSVGIQANGTRGAFGQRDIVGGPVVGGPGGALLARALACFILVSTFRADRALSRSFFRKETDFTRDAFGKCLVARFPVVGRSSRALLAGTFACFVLVRATPTRRTL